ncbi:MAG: TIM barrel protein [Candidatus Thorarchaeota archaeon]
MLGISIRANWDIEKVIDSIINLKIDLCEVQLDNPIFKFQENQKKLIKLINKIHSSDVHLSFHLSFIDLNIASLDNKLRYYSTKVLIKEIRFVKRWNPSYVVVHTGKISDTFFEMPSVKENAHKQHVKSISELINISNIHKIPFAIENRQKSRTSGLIQNVNDIRHYNQLFPTLQYVLDIGHLNTFYTNLNMLFKEISLICEFPLIAIHLSNNYGKDTHRSLADGSIPFKTLFSKIPALKEKFLIIESSSFKDSLESLDFLHNLNIGKV